MGHLIGAFGNQHRYSPILLKMQRKNLIPNHQIPVALIETIEPFFPITAKTLLKNLGYVFEKLPVSAFRYLYLHQSLPLQRSADSPLERLMAPFHKVCTDDRCGQFQQYLKMPSPLSKGENQGLQLSPHFLLTDCF